METTAPAPVEAPTSSKSGPKDFFLWAGAMIALYVAISSFIALCFEYINYAYPDPLAYWSDPYSGTIRFSMAALIVLAPTIFILMQLIRRSIANIPEKADTWVRRWALMLTLFIAGFSIVVDLITLVNTYLGGEISTRFTLKAVLVLLVATLVFLHFLADLKGYWIHETGKAKLVGIAVFVLAILSVISGFFIIGTPGTIRLIRFDEQKIADLQNIQYQITTYWQQKHQLPNELVDLTDPLGGFVVPTDAQTGTTYRYVKKSPTTFTLCALFNKPSPVTAGRGASVTYPPGSGDENWLHVEGESCFARTIDPERYPPFPSMPPVKAL